MLEPLIGGTRYVRTPDKPIIMMTQAVQCGTNREVLLPSQIFYGRPKDESPITPITTNGLAVHRTLARAAEHATIELIERHTVLADWYGLSKRFGSLTDDVTDLGLAVREYLSARGTRLDVLVAESIVGLPVAMCIASDEGAFSCGFGCARSIDEAVDRAYKEVLRPFMPAVSSDNKLPAGQYSSPERPLRSMPGFDAFYRCVGPAPVLDYYRRDRTTLSRNAKAIQEPIEKLVDDAGVRLYWKDITPAAFTALGYVVVRAFSPDLFPLTWDEHEIQDRFVSNDLKGRTVWPHPIL